MKIKKIKFKKSNIASIIIIMFYFSFLVDQLINMNLSLVTSTISLFGLFTLTNLKRSESKIVIWVLVLYIFMLVSTLYTKNIEIIGIIRSFQYIIIALMLYKYKLSPIIMYFSFCIHIVFFIFHMGMATDVNEIFQSSRNMISIVLIIQTTLLYKARIENNLKFSFVPALMCFVISLWAVGRGGIISSSIILIGILIATITDKNKKKNITAIALIAIFLTFISNFNLQIMINLSNNIDVFFDRFDTVGLESYGRDLLQNEYLYQFSTNAISFLLGVPIYENNIFANFNFNLHNSFIELHMHYGLGGFLWITITIILSLIYFLRNNNIIAFFILLALLARIYVDSVAFYGIFDSILYYFIFCYLGKSYSKKKENLTERDY